MDCCFGRKDYAVTGYDVNLISADRFAVFSRHYGWTSTVH
jgi:hypothetical protein